LKSTQRNYCQILRRIRVSKLGAWRNIRRYVEVKQLTSSYLEASGGLKLKLNGHANVLNDMSLYFGLLSEKQFFLYLEYHSRNVVYDNSGENNTKTSLVEER